MKPGNAEPAAGPERTGWSTVELLPPSSLASAAAGRARGRGVRAGTLVDELPSLAPRGVGEILDTALHVLRGRFLACVVLAAALWLPAIALGRLALRAGGFLGAVSAGTGILAQLCVQSLAVGLVTVIVYGEMQGRPAGAGTSAAVALRRAPALLVATLGINLAIFFGTLCCLLPGVAIAWLCMVAPAALVLERLSPAAAIGRSTRLVQGSFWRWAGTGAAETALVLPLTGLAALLGEAWVRPQLEALSGLGPLAVDALDVLLSSLFMAIATALGAVVLTVFYLDCRVRTEGFDLVMRFERLRDRAAPARAGGALLAPPSEGLAP